MVRSIRPSKSDRIVDAVINMLLVFIFVIVFYPLYFVVIASVSDPQAINAGKVLLWPVNVSLDAYKRIFADMRIWTGYRNSIVYTLGGTLVGVTATILAGYAFSRKDLRGRRWLMTLYVFTMYFSGGLIPTYLIVKQLHLVNTIWVMMTLGTLSVYNIIIARSFFASTIPEELREAAFVDGCGNGKFFFSIVLPLSKAIVAVITLYYAVGHWNSFFQALIYLNRQQLYPLQLVLRDILISSQLIQTGETDVEMLLEMQRIAETIKYGVIIVSSVPVMLLYPFVQKYFIKGVMIGSIKG